MKLTDKQSLQQWEEFRQNLIRSTSVDTNESEIERAKRIAQLEANPEAWFAYYFPNYYRCKPAKFHIRATHRILANDRWYEVRAWSRELAKSARSMFEVLYLALTGKIRNVLLVSNSEDNAIRLLNPLRINLESNQRIINDYGNQKTVGQWEEGEFVTPNGVSFRALGAGQSPRGTRNEESRVDFILIDDLDTDAECRNKRIIDQKWQWVEQALMPTVSISNSYRILFNGNIIAKDCCITRAMQKANHVDVINIRDKQGKSVWPEKNTEADIDRFLSLVSYSSAQKEYFNNPVTEGAVFKELRWDNVPSLSKFRYLVAYGDPAPSNKENRDSCYKFVGLVGMLEGTFYIIRCYLDHVTNARFIEWFYEIYDYVAGRTHLYFYIENNSLQDPFFEQVLSPLVVEIGKQRSHFLCISPDERKKPDKYTRIEGTLEPLNRAGRLIFNIEERSNPNMQRLEEQFKAVDPQLSTHTDGPDGVEGAIWIANSKQLAMAPIRIGKKPVNQKRY